MAHKMEKLEIKNVLLDRLICDKCGAEMRWDGVEYTTYPPKYPYFCPECHNTMIVDNPNYPKYYLELSDGTMLKI